MCDNLAYGYYYHKNTVKTISGHMDMLKLQINKLTSNKRIRFGFFNNGKRRVIGRKKRLVTNKGQLTRQRLSRIMRSSKNFESSFKIIVFLQNKKWQLRRHGKKRFGAKTIFRKYMIWNKFRNPTMTTECAKNKQTESQL